MAIQWKHTYTIRTKQATWTDLTTWTDSDGVEWDVDHINQFEGLRRSVQGMTFCPWNEDYEDTRTHWLGNVKRWPSAMVICITRDDIEACCAFAQKNNISIALYSPEYPLTESSLLDGSLVLDLSLVD